MKPTIKERVLVVGKPDYNWLRDLKNIFAQVEVVNLNGLAQIENWNYTIIIFVNELAYFQLERLATYTRGQYDADHYVWMMCVRTRVDRIFFRAVIDEVRESKFDYVLFDIRFFHFLRQQIEKALERRKKIYGIQSGFESDN